MFLLQQILPAAALAMMVAAGICSFALYLDRDAARSALGPVGLGLAYFSGHMFIVGWVRFPPADTTNWLPYFALVAALLGAFCGTLAAKAWVRGLIFAAVSAGALALLLKPKFAYAWSLTEGCIWVACLAGGTALLAMILDALVRRSRGFVETPVFLLITCAGTFGALMLSGSILLGQFAAVLGAAVFGSLVFLARKVALGRGIVPVVSLLLGTLLVSAYFFAALPAVSAVLLAFAPGFALLPIGQPGKAAALGIRAALVSVPVAAALVVAFLSSPPLD